MVKWFLKKGEEVKYRLPRKYTLTKPIPQGDKRGVTEKFITLSDGRRTIEFPIADPIFITMFRQMDYPYFDITLEKKVKYMTLKVGIRG